MNSFKSSPLLQNGGKGRFSRNSKRVEKKRISKQQEYRIPNPFHQCEQENYLPRDLKSQIQDLEYISPTQIQSINFNNVSGKRRSSAFNRHLVTMQNAAKKQEEMYKYFTGDSNNRKQTTSTQAMQQQELINISQNDDISLGMQHCFLRMQNDPVDNEDLHFFVQEMQEQNVVFYSQNNIYSSQDLHDDYEAYFDV